MPYIPDPIRGPLFAVFPAVLFLSPYLLWVNDINTPHMRMNAEGNLVAVKYNAY